jgi:signal transduction histidine kinase
MSEQPQQVDRWVDSSGESGMPMYSTDLRTATGPGGEMKSTAGRLRWLETVAATPPQSTSADSLLALLHDTRNMVCSIDLYCDLLEEPDVLSSTFRHYAAELRLIAGASRGLLEKLAKLVTPKGSAELPITLPIVNSTDFRRQDPALAENHLWPQSSTPTSVARSIPASARVAARNAGDHFSLGYPQAVVLDTALSPVPDRLSRTGRSRAFQAGEPVVSLAEELQANHNLLSALAGHGIGVGLSISGGHRPIAMTSDDLTRVLVNLVRNAAEAIQGGGHAQGGHIQIDLEDGPGYLSLTLTDNGPGIPVLALETIFSPGYTTHLAREAGDSVPVSSHNLWPVQHRGLGLSIVRSIVTAADGSVWASNRTEAGGRSASSRGAIFILEFPHPHSESAS